MKPSLDWLNPFTIDSTSSLTAGILVAIFIYWGWDSLVSVNEETEDKERTPGVAAIVSTIILVLHLRDRVDRRAGVRRAGLPRRQRATTCSAPSVTACSAGPAAS